MLGISKPHIRLRGGAWECFAVAIIARFGYGPTPRAAFKDWKAGVQLAGRYITEESCHVRV